MKKEEDRKTRLTFLWQPYPKTLNKVLLQREKWESTYLTSGAQVTSIKGRVSNPLVVRYTC